MKRKLQLVCGSILLVTGALAVTPTGVSQWLLILPAIPFYMFGTWIDASAKHGLLWDSAHSPPFLNPIGITVIYFLPGVLLILLPLLRFRAGRTGG